MKLSKCFTEQIRHSEIYREDEKKKKRNNAFVFSKR